MGRDLTADVVASSTLALLLRLQAEGFEVQAGPDVLRVRPVARVTPELLTELREHKANLLMLVRICDEGVQDRRKVFRRQIETAPPEIVLPRLVHCETPYVQGRCHTCGDELETDRWGSCWRCMLARRLACGTPIPTDLLDSLAETHRAMVATEPHQMRLAFAAAQDVVPLVA